MQDFSMTALLCTVCLSFVPTSANASIFNLNADIGIISTLSSSGGQFSFISGPTFEAEGSGFLRLPAQTLRASLTVETDAINRFDTDQARLFVRGIAFAENTQNRQNSFRLTAQRNIFNVNSSSIIDRDFRASDYVGTISDFGVAVNVDFLDSDRPDFNRGFGTTSYGFFPGLDTSSASRFISFLLQPGERARVTYLGTAGLAMYATVPEPLTWTLSIMGFGCIGGSMRLNRRSGEKLSRAVMNSSGSC